jgi:hypothetical protein
MRNIAIIAFVAVIALSMAACGDGDGGGGGGDNDKPKTIIIIGITSGATSASLKAMDNLLVEDGSAYDVAIVDGSATFKLKYIGGDDWTGSGPKLINLGIIGGTADGFYHYTDGKTMAELGITTYTDYQSKLPKYNITSATTTIGFDKFTKALD